MAGVDLETQAKNEAALKRSTSALSKVLDAIGVGGKDGLADVGVEAVNRVRVALSTPGKGRVYRRGKVLHRASAPGQPPAVDTGQLRASYTHRLGEDAEGPYVEIGTNLKTAPWLEFGTRRMQPRPHLRPAVASMRNEITRLIRDGIVEKQTQEIRRLPKEIGE